MANSSPEYWDIDGVSLHQYGWSVTTFGGSRYDLPPWRGENIKFAYRPGQIHRNKTPDSRTVELVMWLAGADPGTGNATGDPLLRFNDSWDFLRRTVWRPDGSQVSLTRRWFLTIGGSKTLLAATAQAQVQDSMSPTMTGRTRADFTMSMLLADPFFYGDEVEVNFSGSTTVVNPGHGIAAHNNMEIELSSGARLTNTSLTPNVWVQVGGSGRAVLDVGNFTATSTGYSAYSGPNRLGDVTHSGARRWMALVPGTNNLTCSSGTATIRYRPPYI